jgi:hypothetical protein
VNATGRVPVTTGTAHIEWVGPGDVKAGDVMILADMPQRTVNSLGWQRFDSITDRTSAFVRVAVPGDTGALWQFKLNGPPLSELDHPVWLILRDVYVGRHFDERETPVEVPL